MIKPVARGSPDRAEVLASTSRVPNHVVHRAFAHETVVLNLETGKYHGLNPTAGLMLVELEKGGTVSDVAARLVSSNGWELETVATDLVELCADLVARGLLVLIPPAADA